MIVQKNQGKHSSKKCKKAITELLCFIEKAGQEPALRQKYLIDPNKDFTRKRKLPFSTTALIILHLLKKAYPLFLSNTSLFLKKENYLQNPLFFKLERK